jgi:uncharacterized Fe-S cluster protein YjdI
MSDEIRNRYSNGEVAVLWRPGLCIHCEACKTALPEVFNPDARPWVSIFAAPTAAIVQAVQACPSQAISLAYPNDPEFVGPYVKH